MQRRLNGGLGGGPGLWDLFLTAVAVLLAVVSAATVAFADAVYLSGTPGWFRAG